MIFAQPEAFYVWICMIFMAFILIWAARRRRVLLARLADTHLFQTLSASVNGIGRHWRIFLWFFAFFWMVFALARPQWGKEVQVVEQKSLQVIFALDVSPSMLAQDIKPDRLTRAKLEIGALLDQMAGDEVGLVLFSGSAYLQFPLTSDYNTARSFIDAADPLWISARGTAFGDALRVALHSFDERRSAQKVLVIISDGEDHAADSFEEAKKAADAGVIIYSVGIGTLEGAPIPIYNEQGEDSGFLKNQQGELVISRLNQNTLQKLAAIGKGKLYFIGTAGLLDEWQTLQREQLSSQFEQIGIERYQGFLWVAFLALLIAEVLPRRRAVFLMLILVSCSPSAQRLNNDGNALFNKGNFAQSLEQYQKAQTAIPQRGEPLYNAANSKYKQQEYAQAQQLMLDALQKKEGIDEQSVYYNLGNSYFQAAQYEQAIEAYKEALRLNPKDKDAKLNLELAQKKKQDEQQKPTDSNLQQKPQPTAEGTQSNPSPSNTIQPQKDDQKPEKQPQKLSPQQAEQLLDAASQKAESLQRYLQRLNPTVSPLEQENW